MTLKFGTDGIRGVANTELTPELSLALGRAAVRVFDTQQFLIGRDTRLSGPALSAALAAGCASAGAQVEDVGVLPTPALAHLSAELGIPAAMISASHNPFQDNGIKFFLAGGKKLSDEIETQLEIMLDTPVAHVINGNGSEVGDITHYAGAPYSYVQHLVDSLGGEKLDGLTVVLDCANGAASPIAQQVFEAAGAKVHTIHDEPDGRNINDKCGSTYPQDLQKKVVELKADAGMAFDGDADRVQAVDHTGALIDGDHILGMLALAAHEHGNLTDDTLVVTVMSNLGLLLAMKRNGINVHTTDVGDRYVLEALDKNKWSLGGEQSGHVIFPALSTTGDGMLTALQVLRLIKRKKQSLKSLATVMTRLPQVLKNVPVKNRAALTGAKSVWDEVRAAEGALGEQGRVLLRPSGTEPLIRVMVEAPTIEQATAVSEHLSTIVAREL